MKFRKLFAWGISGALFLVASLLIISRLTFRVLDKCEEILSCSNVQCDDAIFSALAHDDNFGRRILLQVLSVLMESTLQFLIERKLSDMQ